MSTLLADTATFANSSLPHGGVRGCFGTQILGRYVIPFAPHNTLITGGKLTFDERDLRNRVVWETTHSFERTRYLH